ncbi:hypothetical protein [Ktedonospora formicarum]|uniref:hypothetical protein n=1 Tax=Ktedonospora formicarum TaxID=2778364 RepID=UPI001C68E4F2|nr:hypothetical protein [Ktedonospora formicarum]
MRYQTKRKQSSNQSRVSSQSHWWVWWTCFWGAYWLFHQWLIALGALLVCALVYTAWKHDWLHRRKPTIIYVSRPVPTSTQIFDTQRSYEQGYQAAETLEDRSNPDTAYYQYEQPQTHYPEQEPPGMVFPIERHRLPIPQASSENESSSNSESA